MGRVVVPGSQKKPPYWRYDIIQNNLLMSGYHLSDDNVGYYVDKIVDFKPREIFGHPSSIARVSKYIVDNNLSILKPNVIITTAETLLPYQRQVIQKAFSCPVVDQYGCTEMAFFASQCPNGIMHFHPEHAVVEVLPNAGRRNGKEGELVTTSLLSQAMPLIRYRVGDSVNLGDQSADCHSSFPVISHLEGRIDDYIYTKDGRAISRLASIFSGDKHIKLAQLTQSSGGDVQILVVPTTEYSSVYRQMIYNEARERLGYDIEIKIKEVFDIPREANGKFRPIQSFYRPEN
ncbi:phenylacetate--CoA ligase family protein [Marinobacter sp. X15-166B]|uniref:phenylacetate--CoA ligase family protein n=1 Tax=Marinobacter sp. X15-166B TaxID=1897620 RepID=UPI00114D219D|nr:phenylacetate--CoA ligase family protein [Marinobacter sp. X15-166B]